MDANKTGSPVVLIIAWLNYLFSHVFTMAVLSKIALVLSIIGSVVYIATGLYKFFKLLTKK